MNNARHLRRIHSDFTDTELRTALATMTGVDAGDVCEVAAVIIVHGPGGDHQVRIAVDNDSPAARIASVFEHAAAHVRGNCRPCAAEARKRGRHGR